MKSTKNIPLVALVSVMSVATLGYAADYGTHPDANQQRTQQAIPEQIGDASAMSTLTGVVQRVDKSNKSLQIQDSNGVSQTLKIGKTTEITRDGLAVQLAEVKKGDTITVKNAGAAM